MNVRTIWDLLNQIPGISASESFVTIRGSSKVKVFLDGRPINDPTSYSSGAVRFDLVSLEDVQKIKILMGKGALKYGDNATGGVILIFTKKGKKLSGNIKTFGGRFDTYHLSTNIRSGKKDINFGLSFGYDYTDGYLPNNDKKKKRIGAKLSYKNVKILFDYLTTERGIHGRKEYPTLHYRKETDIYSYSFGLNYKKISFQAFLNDAKTENRDPERNIYNFLKVKHIGSDLSYNFSLKRFGHIELGTYCRINIGEGKNFASKTETSISFFGRYGFDLFKRLSFSLGIRKTNYSEYKDQLNPEIKISYKLDKLNLSFSYNRTNNTPTFYQRYERTSTKIPNPDIDLESSDNISFSFFAEPSSFFSIGTTLFYREIKNKISYTHKKGEWIGYYTNFGKVTCKGADISINFKPTKYIFIKTNYSYLKAIDETKKRWLVAKPRHKIYSDIFFRPSDNVSFVFNIKFESKQYTRSDNTASVPSRAIFGLRFECSPVWLRTRFGKPLFFIEAKNLSDKDYCYGDGYPAPPFNFICGVNFSF